MSPFLSVILLFLGSYVDPVAQASVLLEKIPNLWMQLETPITFDDSGCLWITADFEDGIHIIRLDQKGNVLLGKLIRKYEPIQDRSLGFPTNLMIFDRWGNGYFVYNNGTGISNDYPVIRLMRVSPKGDVQEFYPWPEIYVVSHNYIGLINPDTLIIVGFPDEKNVPLLELPLRVAKAVLGPEGIISHTETNVDRYSGYSLFMGYHHDFTAFTVNWQEGWGYSSSVEDSKLTLGAHGITTPTSKQTFLDLPFNHYIWRTYDDTRLPKMAFTPYKDSGYILWVPDPDTRSRVHAVRIDSEGNPLLSSELKDGGNKSSRDFKNLPSDAEPHASFRVYQHGSGLDSAQVIFWGADSDGNMYNYYDVKRYR